MNLKDVFHHFHRVDPKIEQVLQRVDEKRLPHQKDPSIYFESLCGQIIGQQLSGRVADVIEERFRQLLGGKVIAEHILQLEDQQLRDVGMSWAKVRSVRDLSQKTVEHGIEWSSLPSIDDEAVIAELTKVKGIGRWTAEMFLIFTLGREDVFSFGDFGLKKGLMKLYNLEADVSKEKIENITKKWSPYRSYGSLALWQALE